MKYLTGYPISWATVAVILYLSLSRIPETPLDDIPSVDKFVHTGMYGFLCMIIWFERFRQRRPLSLFHCLVGALLLPTLLGGGLELMQEYCTDCRHGSWWDFAANTLGIVIIWPLAWLLRKRISL